MFVFTIALAFAWMASTRTGIPSSTHAFGPIAGCTRIKKKTTTTTTSSQLGVLAGSPLSFRSAGSLVVIGIGGGNSNIADAAAATTSTTTANTNAFTDQIDYLGDPTVQAIVLIFGGVILVLGGLAVLSQKMDAAIENVLVDFETVMTSTNNNTNSNNDNKEFQRKWREIESQLAIYDNEVEKSRLRKQKLFEIMEELERTEPELMKRVSAKMAALNK